MIYKGKWPRGWVIVAAGLVSAFSGLAYSTTVDEIDSDLMLAIEEINDSLASNIALREKRASVVDAKELELMFAEVDKFYATKADADEAIKLVKKSLDLASEIVRTVEADNFDSAAGLATDLSRTCKTCHNFYKKS